MRFLGIDLETTGLDVKTDRILKLGICLYDDWENQFLAEREWTLWHTTYPPISVSAFEIHKIKQSHCEEFGKHPAETLEELAFWIDTHRIDYLIAHNGYNFDFPMLISMAECFAPTYTNFFKNLRKVDTATDIVFPAQIQTRKLQHLAAEHGFVNPFPHSSLSDIRTMFKLLLEYPIGKTLERAKSPTVQVQAKVDFKTKELAKARRFFWEQTSQRWLKTIKLCDLDNERRLAEFEIVQI